MILEYIQKKKPLTSARTVASGPHHWRLTYYKWGLPLAAFVALDYVITGWGRSFGWLFAGILCALFFLWILTLKRPSLSIALTDAAVTAIVWILIVYSMAAMYLTDGHEAAGMLEQLLFWMPFISLYWTMVFSHRICLVAVLVFMFVSFLLGAEHITYQKLGVGIFHGSILRTLALELMMLVLATVYWSLKRKIDAIRAEQSKSLHDMLHDELTGIPNRAAFEMDLRRQRALSHRYGTPLSLALVKIDNLQTINRDLGRDAGDEVLIEVAKTLRAALREVDFAGRWSDDEFILLLPNVALENARQGVECACRKAEERARCLCQSVVLRTAITATNSHENLAEPATRLSAAVAQARARGSREIEVVS